MNYSIEKDIEGLENKEALCAEVGHMILAQPNIREENISELILKRNPQEPDPGALIKYVKYGLKNPRCCSGG